MAEIAYVSIGFTRKTHGVKGELKCSIGEDFEDIALEKGRVFLDMRGRKAPFFIESLRGAGEPIVKFEDVHTREDALPLQSREIFLLESDLPAGFVIEAGDTLEYAHLKGFQVVDKSAGPVGRIDEVLDMPQQEMASVRYRGREIMIPLIAAFILSVDEGRQEVQMDLPEGLLDM